MDDNEFFITLWKLAAICILGLAATIGGCSSYQTSKVADAIKDGASPMVASCGINGINSTNFAVCLQLVQVK